MVATIFKNSGEGFPNRASEISFGVVERDISAVKSETLWLLPQSPAPKEPNISFIVSSNTSSSVVESHIDSLITSLSVLFSSDIFLARSPAKSSAPQAPALANSQTLFININNNL